MHLLISHPRWLIVTVNLVSAFISRHLSKRKEMEGHLTAFFMGGALGPVAVVLLLLVPPVGVGKANRQANAGPTANQSDDVGASRSDS